MSVFRQLASSSVLRSPAAGTVALRLLSTTSLPSFENVKVETSGTEGRVGVVTLNRPKALNALSSALMQDVVMALRHFDRDPSVGCIVLTGNEKAFAAGADIREIKETRMQESFTGAFLGDWEAVGQTAKPILAAVNGFALGGGCELAMLCDIIYAGDRAKFGQPEINLGTIPGAGGTQRLTRAIGKSRAMEMNLTGLPISAQEAERYGLVSKVFPAEKLLDEAIKTADVIAGKSKMATAICKQATNAAYESALTEGLATEKRLFYMTFATHDRKEGMSAFVEKRKPVWKDE